MGPGLAGELTLGVVGPEDGDVGPMGVGGSGPGVVPTGGALAGSGGRFGGVAVTGRGVGWGWPGTGFGSFGKAEATGVPTAPTAVDAAIIVKSALESALRIRAVDFRWRATRATSFLGLERPWGPQLPPTVPQRPPACADFRACASINSTNP